MVIILGASGFIGNYTIQHFLSKGETILGTYFSHKPSMQAENLSFIQFDISNPEDYKKLPKKDVSAVIMLAGRLPANVKIEDGVAYDDSVEYIKENTLATVYALNYCRENKIKTFLYMTSYSEILGHAKENIPIDSDASRSFKFTGDHSAYIISKNAALDFMTHYSMEYGIQTIAFRLPPVYGVGPHGTIYVDGKPYKSGIQTFIEKAQNGENIELWGDKKLYRDIIYVKDLAAACYDAIHSEKSGGAYNISNGQKLYLEDQIRTIIEVFGNGKSKIVYRPEKPNNSPSYVLDVSKAERDFGFAPKYKDYKDMMLDYKKDLESQQYSDVFKSRIEKS